MKIVIIGQNEGKSIQPMLDSLKPYSQYSRIWVLDRCSDDSAAQLKSAGEFFIETPSWLKGRQTAYSRNLGASAAGDDDILFLDGDRWITSGSIAGIESSETDIQLLRLENDSRNSITDYQESYGTVYNGFFSCGLFMKKTAIQKVIQFQGELFKLSTQEKWGIEDCYLGDVCYHLKLTADLYKCCKLAGKFDRLSLDNGQVLVDRFKLRDKLNVKW